jgi:NADPH-dependent 2,4-dienoyl-CoA reductase/sulfur reductase-like enzyme
MRILIIGNGIAGATAARNIRLRSDHSVTMISDESWQPFSRTALMYVYMGRQKLENTYLYEADFWERNRIERVLGRVTRVNPDARTVALADGQTLPFDCLILAAGARPKMPGLPGETLEGIQGLYHLHDLDMLERRTPGITRAVLVGGGLIGVELAEMLHARGIPVSFLVRESSFWNTALPPEESDLINRHLREYGIDLRLDTCVQAFVGDENGRVCAASTTAGETIPCNFVGLTVGVRPNIAFLRDSGIECAQGVLADEFLETNRPGIFAIGDCAELRRPSPGRKAIEAIWYAGRKMGETVAATVCGEKTAYQPGLWFNSAKFFDIEYQAYGETPAQTPPSIACLHWEHPGVKKSIRIYFERAGGAVTGFLLLGIRYRQAVCEKWIQEKTSIETVLPHLSAANFDPEFSRQYEGELAKRYARFEATTGRLGKI